MSLSKCIRRYATAVRIYKPKQLHLLSITLLTKTILFKILLLRGLINLVATKTIPSETFFIQKNSVHLQP